MPTVRLLFIYAILPAALAGACSSSERSDANGGDAARCSDGSTIHEQPSRQTVTIRVQNVADAVRYIPTRGDAPGWECSTFGVSAFTARGELVPVRLRLPPECPDCTDAGVCTGTVLNATEVVRLEPGESTTMTWDGRGLKLCEARSPHCRHQPMDGRLQPLPPGQYNVLAGSHDALPPGCTSSPNGRVHTCDPALREARGINPLHEACLAPDQVGGTALGVPFDLPESGDIEILVPLK